MIRKQLKHLIPASCRQEIGRLRNYFRQNTAAFRNPSFSCPAGMVWSSARYFLRWRESEIKACGGATLLKERLPWITFPAIDYLEKIISKDWSVFEFGSGGSSLWYGARVNKVISVEHFPEWYQKVKAELIVAGRTNCEIRLLVAQPLEGATPDPSDTAAYGSLAEGFRNHSFQNYVRAIDTAPDESFDLISIDGRSRPSCMFHSLLKLKPGGWLLLDNSEREWYRAGIALVSSWKKVHFGGPLPFSHNFSETTFWQKPS